MRIIQSQNPRVLSLLAVGPDGLIGVANGGYHVREDVEVWNAASGTRQCAYTSCELGVTFLAFTPVGNRLLVGEASTLNAVDTRTGERKVGLPTGLGGYARFALSKDGRTLVAGENRRSPVLSVWDFDADAVRRRWDTQTPGDKRYTQVAANTDGTHLAVVLLDESSDRTRSTIQLHDAGNGKVQVAIPTDAASPVQQLAFTADGSKLLVRTDSRVVQLFDAATGASAGELVHPGRPFVTGIAVHRHGPVACARTNGTVTFWDAEKCEQLRTLDWKAGKLVSVAFSPDGALATTGTENGKIVVWDVDF